MVGQACFAPGEAKNTYGTGNFMLLNTGDRHRALEHGLLTTVVLPDRRRASRSTRSKDRSPSPDPRCSGCATSSGSSARRGDRGARGPVADNGGVYFVPAFSGLFAPYWRTDARGAIVGLSRFNTKAHLARATLEAICFQTRDVLDAMVQDSGVRARGAEGGRRRDRQRPLMQLQADILGVPVGRPAVAETTALGAAYAAGLAVGFWSDPDELRANWNESRRGSRSGMRSGRDGYAGWRKAVERTLDWVDVG